MVKRPKTSAGRGKGKTKTTIFACIDRNETSHKVVPVAQSVADAIGATVALVHVIDPREAAHAPLDPVEWEIARREAHEFASNLASRFGGGGGAIEARVLEGKCAEQLCGCVSPNAEDIVAICRGSVDEPYALGPTARRVLDMVPGSFLMVPANLPDAEEVKFRRVFVPLDGSAQAETALPAAEKLAASQDAELVLVHATPEPVLTKTGPFGVKDKELIERINRRNEKVARDYLARIRSRIGSDVAEITPLVLKGGDVRRQLTDGMAAKTGDIIVLASHGHSGYADVALGDVASFVIARACAPVLMIRKPGKGKTAHVYSEARSKGARRPAAEMQ